MSFLRVNGIVAPVSIDGASEEPQLVEDTQRSEGATLIVDRRAEKGKWSVDLVLQQTNGASPTLGGGSQAQFWRKFLHGEGQYASFDASLYTSKGLAPSTATATTQVAGGAWLGAGRAQQTAATGVLAYVALPPGSVFGWTVMVARKTGLGSFQHFLTNSLGDTYIDGVLTGSTPWLSVNTSSGTVTLTSDAVDTTHLDELAIYPFVFPGSWPAQIYAFQNPVAGNAQIGALRYVKIDGDAVDDSGGVSPAPTRTCIARVTGTKVRHVRAAGNKRHIRVMSVEFEEV